MTRYWAIIWLFFMCLSPLPLLAHPVTYEGATMINTMFGSHISDLRAVYSISHKQAAGIRYAQFLKQNKPYIIGQYNILLKRWNAIGAQGNIYATSGLGVPVSETSSLLTHVGLQADYETRRVYTAGKVAYYGADSSLWFLQARVGFAPYLGGFDALHTWLILQLDDQILSGQHTTMLMPVLRLFYKNGLVEFGSTFSGHYFFTTMIHI